MARISKFEKVTKDRHRVHDLVDCGYSIFSSPDGKRYLQLDTYGRADRKFVGDASQSLQFDEATARKLKQLLETAFPSV
jgi:hypothetical protein